MHVVFPSFVTTGVSGIVVFTTGVGTHISVVLSRKPGISLNLCQQKQAIC